AGQHAAALHQKGRGLLGPHPAVRCERMGEAHDRCLFGSSEVVMDAAAGEVKQHVGESQALQAGEKVSRWTLRSIGVRSCGWSGGVWPKVEDPRDASELRTYHGAPAGRHCAELWA